MAEKQYIEQAIAILEKYREEATSDNTFEVEQTLEQIQNIFDITEKNLAKIRNILQKTKLKPAEKANELSEGDKLILKGILVNMNPRKTEEYRKAVDLERDFINIDALYKYLKKRLKKLESDEDKRVKKEAMKKLEDKGIEVNAENLAKEANISVEEAQKYLNKVNQALKAQAARNSKNN